MTRRPLYIALLLCVLCLTTSAHQLGTWQLYLSYQIATKSDMSGSIIYSLMNGNLLSYDTEDGEVRTYDHLSELSDVNIAYIAYSKEAERLLIVYSNSNIDLLGRDGTILNLSALKDKRILGKEVSYVSIYGTTAYLATGFGFVTVDMKEGVFLDTYKMSRTVQCITASDDKVFIATPNGVYQCPKSSNMQLEDNWSQRSTWATVMNMCYYQGKVMALTSATLYEMDPGSTTNTAYDRGSYTYLKHSGDYIFWGNKTQLGMTSDLTASPTILDTPANWSDVSYVKGTYWMSEQENGLRGYKITGTEIVPTGEVIQPSSPIRDLGYSLTWVGDRLLVAGGINTVSGFSNPATAMYYENGEWTNFTEMTVPPEYPRLQIINTTNLVQDPTDDTHHFASLYRGGLVEYRNGKFVKNYNRDNSPLQSIFNPPYPQYYNYVTCSGLSYDGEGNLWMASSQVDTVLHYIKPNGKWVSLTYDEIKRASLIDQILHHSSGIKLISSRRLDMRGIFCLDTKGTERVTDDRTILLQNIVNQDNTSYSPEQFFCLQEDLDGTVWVGTSSGLFAIEDVSKVFDKDFHFTQVKINRNDGSGLADYLLNDVSIACISFDAANRKWIGTQTNGAFLISADGQEMIHHFTTDNSPLLSNNVQSIAAHPGTGEVIFGTDKGLCSYMGDATLPEAELEKSNVTIFPNPVTPDYNGPIAIRGLVNDTEVKILSTGGQLVWNGRSAGGTCIWNGCANNGLHVASGIYHVVANTPEGGKAIVTRIVIVR